MDGRLSILSPEPGSGARVSRLDQNENQTYASDPESPPGIGMGPIDPRFLERDTWPLEPPERIHQYRKFVQLMVNRIRAGESDDAETRQFVDLFGGPKYWLYMVPILGFLPELVEFGPHATNDQMTILVEHVHSIISEKQKERLDRIANNSPRQPKAPPAAEELIADVRERVAKLLFGSRGAKQATPAMLRLLASWVEMAYPEDTLQDIIDKNDIRGRVISRDSLGLPAGLRERQSESRKTILKNRKKDLRSTAKASLTEPASTEYFSSDDPLDAKQKNSHNTYNPGDSASPPSSDNPDKSLLWESTDSESSTSKGVKPVSATKPSFWDFVRIHSPEYADGVGPIRGNSWGNNRVTWCSSLAGSSKVTDQGTTVVKGFNKPSPEMSYAIMKEIDIAATNLNLALSKSEEELMIRRQQEMEEARRRDLKARPNLND
ncbi:MAG: hypothetical protein Q9224_003562, partial [Gallowayella concinna]